MDRACDECGDQGCSLIPFSNGFRERLLCGECWEMATEEEIDWPDEDEVEGAADAGGE